MSETIPKRVPPCAERLLARPQWYPDPGLVSRVKLTRAKWFARILSSEFFAKTSIAAITLGRTIHYRDLDYFDPHTPHGLALLAHEIKHVEQYERYGFFRFFAKYIRDYFAHGYGDDISFEGEAYAFERQVRAHLLKEFRQNGDTKSCLDLDEPHRPDIRFFMLVPE